MGKSTISMGHGFNSYAGTPSDHGVNLTRLSDQVIHDLLVAKARIQIEETLEVHNVSSTHLANER